MKIINILVIFLIFFIIYKIFKQKELFSQTEEIDLTNKDILLKKNLFLGVSSNQLEDYNNLKLKDGSQALDLGKNNLIEAKFSNVVSTKLCTTLANDQGAKVSTVEHLLAALYIHGIDNAAIEIDNEEVPIMDGSAKNFLEKLRSTDIIEQSKKRNYLKVTKKLKLVFLE